MIRLVVLLSIAACAAPPSPPPTPTPPPPPPPIATCRPDGASAIQITKKTGDDVTERTTYFGSGGWTYEAPVPPDTKGEAVATHGCLTPAQQTQIAADLTAIDWTVEKKTIHCMAKSLSTIEFSVGPDVKYTQHVCGDGLAKASARHLAAVVATLSAATAAP